MIPRIRLSPAQRHAILNRQDGRCGKCSEAIIGGDFHIDHYIPLAIGGKDEDSNRIAVHPECHREKTSETDRPMIDKARRVGKKHAAHMKAMRTGALAPNAKERALARMKLQRRGGLVAPRQE